MRLHGSLKVRHCDADTLKARHRKGGSLKAKYWEADTLKARHGEGAP